MPKTKSYTKTDSVTARVTPHVKKIVVQLARSEGLDISEWLRNLIVKELKDRGVLTTSLALSGLESQLEGGSEG